MRPFPLSVPKAKTHPLRCAFLFLISDRFPSGRNGGIMFPERLKGFQKPIFQNMDSKKKTSKRWDESESAKRIVALLESYGFSNVSFKDGTECPNAKKIGLRHFENGGFRRGAPIKDDPIVVSMALGSLRMSIRVCAKKENADGVPTFLYYVRGDSEAGQLASDELKEVGGEYLSVMAFQGLISAVSCACRIVS